MNEAERLERISTELTILKQKIQTLYECCASLDYRLQRLETPQTRHVEVFEEDEYTGYQAQGAEHIG